MATMGMKLGIDLPFRRTRTAVFCAAYDGLVGNDFYYPEVRSERVKCFKSQQSGMISLSMIIRISTLSCFQEMEFFFVSYNHYCTGKWIM